MDEPLARVEVGQPHDLGAGVTARVVGEVDLSNVQHVESVLLGAVHELPTGDGPAMFVIDLSPTTYLDSAALRSIENVSRACADRALSLRLVAPDGSFAARILAISGLDTQISVVPSADPVPSDDPAPRVNPVASDDAER